MKHDACFWAFLAGYMDAEGYIGTSRGGHGQALVEISSGDVGILRGLRAGLNARGVSCPRVSLKVRAGTVRPSGQTYNVDLYRLGVYSKASLDKLFQKIDPYLKHRDRRKAMAKAWANIRRRGLP
jgi:hypothetical protein